jgi:DNA-binding MarR family transcriptional regulator
VPVSVPSQQDADVLPLLAADVFEAAGVLRRHGERIAASAGQTQARWQLMSVVSAGDWTVPRAADRLGTSRQAVQRIASELIADGLAAYARNPRHRRSPFLRLTSHGSRVLAAITRQARPRHCALAGELGPADVARLRAGLRQLTAAVRRELETGDAPPG